MNKAASAILTPVASARVVAWQTQVQRRRGKSSLDAVKSSSEEAASIRHHVSRAQPASRDWSPQRRDVGRSRTTSSTFPAGSSAATE